MKRQDLKKCELPSDSGVYFFRDENGGILYIGKATSLSDRVKSYFNDDVILSRGLRIKSMVTIAKIVTFQKTDSVLEALLLESLFIKKYNPPYNVKEKDNKSFSCVVIMKEKFPRVLIMRIRDFEKKLSKKDVLKVYGPFPSQTQLSEAMKIIRKLFPYRDKCLPLDKSDINKKPCFNAQIKLCPGVCIGAISEKDYKKNITNIVKLFEGNKKAVQNNLKKEMNSYAKKHLFEKAKEARDTIFALDHIKDTNLIKEEDIVSFKDRDFRIEGYDVAHISGTSRVGVMVVIEGKEKKKEDYRKFKLIEKVNDDYGGLREVLKRRFSHKEWRLPDLIVFDGGIGQKQTGEKVIAEMGLYIPCVSVVKDNKHKPKDILGDKIHINQNKKEILLINSEAHRFSISYHKKLRSKII